MSRIHPRLLQSFVAIARAGNVTRAAERLHLTQPAVSLHLKELSAITRLELFERTPHGVLLTRDGAALLVHAEKVLVALDEFAVVVQRLKGAARGRLRIGTILDPEFTRLGAFLHELMTLGPEIEPELRHGISGDVLEWVAGGAVDAGYYISGSQGHSQADIGRRKVPRIRQEILSRFVYRVIAPQGWDSQVQGKDWAMLTRLPWILTPPRSAHSRLLRQVLEPLKLVQNQVALVDQEASMLALVRSGVGLALARDAIAIRETQSNGLIVADSVQLEATLTFVCRASDHSRPALVIAHEALRRAWRA